MWILVLLVGFSAHSFTMGSQYFVATEPEHLLLGSWNAWDSEASSDFIVYQRPLVWDEQWLRGNKVFDLSVGSISTKQFLTLQRLKLHQPLNDKLDFNFNWLEQRDFEQDRRATALELSYQFTAQFSLAVFGQPSLYKSEDDVGAAVSLRPLSQWRLQLAALYGDFQRNQKNLNSDQWGNAPEAYTFTSVYLPGKGFHHLEAHYEPNSVRTLNGAPVTTLFYKMIAANGLTASGFGYRVQADQAMHNDQTRRRVMTQIEFSHRGENFVLRPGINFFYREHYMNSGTETIREILPTLWMDLPKTWSFGYDATFFDRDSTLQSKQNKIEHRGNIKTLFEFSKAGELALLFTFDLDRFGTGETWEGGAAQFRTEF